MIREFAPAKVNLFLHVTGRRDDGYHLLDSLAVFAAIGDELTAAPDPGLSLAIDGPFGATLDSGAENLVLRAARSLDPERGTALQLVKNLPVAAGIGGGSADAAATLRALSKLWDLPIPTGAAGGLGADVPVCLDSMPARMAGIGEILGAAPRLPPCGLLLANPGIGVATPAVFRARQGGFSLPADLPASWPDAAAMAATLGQCRNDLQAPAIALQPVIAALLAALAALPGALLARMSGSGATCFALFATPAQARQAAASLRPSGWWRWGGGLYEPPRRHL